jgi:hypothetical protein
MPDEHVSDVDWQLTYFISDLLINLGVFVFSCEVRLSLAAVFSYLLPLCFGCREILLHEEKTHRLTSCIVSNLHAAIYMYRHHRSVHGFGIRGMLN